MIDTFAEHPTSARLLLRSLFEDDELTGHQRGGAARRPHAQAPVLARSPPCCTKGWRAAPFASRTFHHTLQSLVGLTVYHFASGEFGEEMFGQSLFAPAMVRKRNEEVKALLHHGLIASGSSRRGSTAK